MKCSNLTYLLLLCLTIYSLKVDGQNKNWENYDVWLQGPTAYHPALRIEVKQLKDTTLFFTSKGTNQELPLQKITNLYVRKKGKIRNTALKSAGISLIAGLAIALIDGPSSEGCLICISAKERIWIYGISFAGNGLLWGALLGGIKMKIPVNNQFNRKRKRRKKIREWQLFLNR